MANTSKSSNPTNSKMPRRVSESLIDDDTTSRSSPPTTKETHHFPYKLYDMLQYAADSEYSSAVSWVDEGRAFAIHDKEALMEHISPLFFNQSKYRSFTRQLNLWGFNRVQGCDMGPKGAWMHHCFLRDDFEALKSIVRIEVKNKTEAENPIAKKINKNTKSTKSRRSCTTTAAKASKPTSSARAATKSRRSRTTTAAKTSKPTSSARAATLGNSSNGSLPSLYTSSDTAGSSPVISVPTITFSAQDSMMQTVSPTNFQYQFQNRTVWQPHQPLVPAMDSGILQPLLASVPSQDENQIKFHPAMVTSASVNADIDQSMTTHNDDILDLLSGMFDSDTNEQEDDLSSILSLNGGSEDSMYPIM